MKRWSVIGIALFAYLIGTKSAASALVGDGIAATVPPFVQVATPLGPTSALKIVHLTIHLAYPNPGGVTSFVQSVTDPLSSNFGNFLSPDQFTLQFGPSGHSYSTVEYAIANLGGSVVRTYPDLKELDVAVPVLVANLLFSTVIKNYEYNGVTYYANSTNALIPFVLNGIVMGVSGFTNYSQHIAVPPGMSSQGFGPLDIQTAYDEPILRQAGLNGSGVTVAVLTASDYLDSDVKAFWQTYGITRTGPITRVPVKDPVDPGISFLPSDETTLDVEQVGASAPGAALEVYEASDPLNSTFDDMYAQVVNDPAVDVVTTSYGSCEAASDPNEVAADSDLFEQAAAEGQTWFAASGDDGSKDCALNDPPFGLPGFPNPTTIDFPASSPEIASVGGTTLTLRSNRQILSETGWSGSGGGVSSLFGLPWYQARVPGASQKARNAPDLALNADPSTPYAMYYLGTFALSAGGTSAAAPNAAAIQAQIDQAVGVRLGPPQGELYAPLFRVANTEALHDVTSGSNGDFAAHRGFDNVTGVGSLDGWRFLQQMQKPAASVRRHSHAPLRFVRGLLHSRP